MEPVSQKVLVFLAECELCLAVPYYPGGSLYARNPPMPAEVCICTQHALIIAMLQLQTLSFQIIDCLWHMQLHQQLDFGREDH